MLPFLAAAILAAQIGPIGPDSPARAPQMTSSAGQVYLTFGAGKAIYFTASTDRGKTFLPPVRVAEAEILPLTRHRGPRIVVAGKAIVITAVTGRKLAEGPHAHGLPSDGDLLTWRSVDGGRTWQAAGRVNDVPGAATEGLHALSAGPRGVLFAAWLDKRGEGTKLYGASSRDGGRTWSKNVEIYESPEGSICQCCHPSVAFTDSGEVAVMWRNWLAGCRDMYLTRSSDLAHFGKPQKLGNGAWKLNACPMDGGGLAATGDGVTAAFRREGEIFLVEPGEAETAIGKGIDVALAPGPKGVYAVWVRQGEIVASAPGQPSPVVLAPKGAFPSVIRLPDGKGLAAWESDGQIAVAPLP